MTRRFLLLLALAPMAPLAAQTFEGTVSFKLLAPGAGTQPIDAVMQVKGERTATTMKLPAGPMGGQEMRMIVDRPAGKATVLMPKSQGMEQMPGMQNAKGVKITQDLPDMSKTPTGPAAKSDIRKLGTSQTIAGFPCDDYELTGENGQVTRMCLATSLGSFTFPALGGPGRSAPPPEWARAVGNKPTFPLKVWSPSTNSVGMEVTAIKRGMVPPSAFEVPEGYVDMAAMMRGGMGGARPGRP